jgi:hypothetical protein
MLASSSLARRVRSFAESGRVGAMDIWSEDDLNRIESRVDYALGTEDDGRVMLIPPQTIKELITEFRRLRTDPGAAPDDRLLP